MVGSAAIKQGRSANRKHTYFFFGLSGSLSQLSTPRMIYSYGLVLIAQQCGQSSNM